MRTVRELMDLGGRVAIVTGGAGHLGAACAAALAELGARVAIADADGDRADQVVRQLTTESGVHARAWVVDLEETDAVRALPAAVAGHWGRLDILVNAAALVGSSALKGWATSFAEQDLDTWRRTLEVNLTAAVALTQASLPWLQQSPNASVINIASIYGVVGPDWRLYEGTGLGSPAAYAASKGGLLQMTRWLATTLAPTIRVNALSPGGIFRGHTDPFLSRYIARTPLGRMATEEDFLGAVAYLASDLSAYVTGQNLLVDGGWTTW